VIGSRQFDSNSSGIFQIPHIVELRNSIPHFPLGMEMEPTTSSYFRPSLKSANNFLGGVSADVSTKLIWREDEFRVGGNHLTEK
jgi:hypothetical protein